MTMWRLAQAKELERVRSAAMTSHISANLELQPHRAVSDLTKAGIDSEETGLGGQR